MPLNYSTLPGDIDHLIAGDHAIVERQFQHLEAGRGNRRVLVDQIAFELGAHAFAEETVLYPVCDKVGMSDANHDARQEHHDLGVHSSEDLDWVAQELNDRPRKRFAFKKADRTDRRPPVAMTARMRRLVLGRPNVSSH